MNVKPCDVGYNSGAIARYIFESEENIATLDGSLSIDGRMIARLQKLKRLAQGIEISMEYRYGKSSGANQTEDFISSAVGMAAQKPVSLALAATARAAFATTSMKIWEKATGRS